MDGYFLENYVVFFNVLGMLLMSVSLSNFAVLLFPASLL